MAYGKVRNGYITTYNDDINCSLGKEPLRPFVVKSEGYHRHHTTNNMGAARGALMYYNPNPASTDPSHVVYALGNQLFAQDNTGVHFLGDVNSLFGFNVQLLSGAMRKGKLFMTVGDPLQGNRLLVYNGAVNPPSARLTIQAIAGMPPMRLLSVHDDRLVGAGTGDDNTNVYFSEFDATGAHGVSSQWVTGTNFDAAGAFAGNVGHVTALEYAGGYTYIFEKDRVTLHKIVPSNMLDVIGRPMWDRNTLVSSLEEVGTYSAKGVTKANDSVYFVSDKGVYRHSVTGGLEDLTDTWKKCYEGSGFDFRTSSISYDKKRRLIYVTASQKKDGTPNDIVLMYSLDTDSWSDRCNIMVNQLLWDDHDEINWGFSSKPGDSYLYQVFDGQYRDDNLNKTAQNGAPICLQAHTQYSDMGNRDNMKEHLSTSIQVLHSNISGSFDMEIWRDDECPARLSQTFPFIDPPSCDLTQGASGCSSEAPGQKMNNKFVKIDTCVFTFRKISTKIKECSDQPFAVSYPIHRVRQTDRYSNPC